MSKFLQSSAVGRPTATEALQKVFGSDVGRNVTIQIPTSFDASPSTPRGIVLVLHQLGGSATNVQNHLLISNLVNDISAAGAFVIAPAGDAISLPGPTTAWNGSTSCGQNDSLPLYPHLDALYLHNLLLEAKAAIGKVGVVDTTRIYVIGQSCGAAMAYRLACLYSADITGIVAIAGGADTAADPGVYGSCDTTHHVAVLDMHGSADTTWAYAGGTPVPGISPAMDNVTGAEASVETYAALNGCSSPSSVPSVSRTVDIETDQAGSETEVRPWSGCSAGGQVTLFKVVGGGHSTNWTMQTSPPNIHDEIATFYLANHR